MKKVIVVVLTLLGFITQLQAEEIKLPALQYVSLVDSEEFYDKLKNSPLLAELDKDNIGTPIRLLVTYRMENTAGGSAAGFTSAILAGGSLGILPVVTNNDFVLSYEIKVQNEVIASAEYRENFTEATNIHSDKGFYGLDGEALTWAISTTDTFLSDMENNAELKALVEEYDYYFAE
ncbi:hypothetical protein A9267_11465 [Shewanella sp. UCD-FRSSP16_17]|uniref:hypothetical protein n=1 Tax=Shewanella sp. UCD-FRSSP16_17 TaxID=1853256 RepID=UPI0007EED97F|nr:hypothetical protein [Shewanella sp. UCD-FRSSP16_17]OBT08315.1 hypothetical protein A9267_11465 [Shewanella sp. UCD-FRSSP16_17]